MTTQTSIVKQLRRANKQARDVGVQTNPNALTPIGRAKARQQLNELRSREAALKVELKAIPQVWLTSLLDAAQFVVDVDGDPVAVERLATAVATAKRRQDILDELRQIRSAEGPLTSKSYRQKYDAYVDDKLCRLIVASADTLDELAKAVAKGN